MIDRIEARRMVAIADAALDQYNVSRAADLVSRAWKEMAARGHDLAAASAIEALEAIKRAFMSRRLAVDLVALADDMTASMIHSRSATNQELRRKVDDAFKCLSVGADLDAAVFAIMIFKGMTD